MKWLVEWYASKGKFNKFNKARGDPRELNNKQDENVGLGCERPVLNQIHCRPNMDGVTIV